MKKRMMFAAAILALALGFTGLSACGGAGKNAAMGGVRTDQAAAEAPAASAPFEPKAEMEYGYANLTADIVDGSTVQQSGSTAGSVYNDPNAKLIREADLTVQTTEFEQAVSQVEAIVTEFGGYFQNASQHGGSYRNVNANRIGEYTIRIPSERYEQFMGRTGELGYVTYRSETTENIGEQYYDTEARLKTQKTKQERLLALLAKAENMEDIISLESALSDVEYEIERLSSTLNRYDSLVGFATIRLTLDEVHKVTEETGVTNSLGQRMSSGFAASVENLIEGAQDLLVWFSYNVFGILIFAVVVSAAALVLRNTVRRRRQKKADMPEKP